MNFSPWDTGINMKELLDNMMVMKKDFNESKILLIQVMSQMNPKDPLYKEIERFFDACKKSNSL